MSSACPSQAPGTTIVFSWLRRPIPATLVNCARVGVERHRESALASSVPGERVRSEGCARRYGKTLVVGLLTGEERVGREALGRSRHRGGTEPEETRFGPDGLVRTEDRRLPSRTRTSCSGPTTSPTLPGSPATRRRARSSARVQRRPPPCVSSGPGRRPIPSGKPSNVTPSTTDHPRDDRGDLGTHAGSAGSSVMKGTPDPRSRNPSTRFGSWPVTGTAMAIRSANTLATTQRP